MLRMFTRFLGVGAFGFAVDASVLAVLVHGLGLDALAARVLSVAVALTATWLANRAFTFGPSGRAMASEGARYGGVGIATSLINYGVYALVLQWLPAMPLAALCIGSGVALLFSFIGYRYLVFGQR